MIRSLRGQWWEPRPTQYTQGIRHYNNSSRLWTWGWRVVGQVRGTDGKSVCKHVAFMISFPTLSVEKTNRMSLDWDIWHGGGGVVFVLGKSYITLCDPLDCSPLGSPVHGIFQARLLEWVVIPSSRGSSQSKDHISCASRIGRQSLYRCANWEAHWTW